MIILMVVMVAMAVMAVMVVYGAGAGGNNPINCDVTCRPLAPKAPLFSWLPAPTVDAVELADWAYLPFETRTRTN